MMECFNKGSTVQELDELINNINILQQVEEDILKSGESVPIYQLKKPSVDLCRLIHTEILALYTKAKQAEIFPSFDENRTFNLELIQLLQSNACNAAYLVAAQEPAANLDYYLTMAEKYGYTDIRIVHFYQKQYAEILQLSTAAALEDFYKTSREAICKQFDLNTGSGRFLDLLMIHQTLVLAQTKNFVRIADKFTLKKEAAVKLFQTTLKDESTKTQFQKFFATGAMNPINTVEDFLTSMFPETHTEPAQVLQSSCKQ